MALARIQKNDTVMVMIGKDRGKQGQVIDIDQKYDRVKVRGINMVTRHVRPKRQGEVAMIKTEEGFIHISNVMPIDASSGKPCRVKVTLAQNGSKIRSSHATETAL